MLNWVTRRPLGRRASSYSWVTALVTMRRVLQTQGDSRSGAWPVVRIARCRFIDVMLPGVGWTSKAAGCRYMLYMHTHEVAESRRLCRASEGRGHPSMNWSQTPRPDAVRLGIGRDRFGTRAARGTTGEAGEGRRLRRL
jgi:hypothetical protein